VRELARLSVCLAVVSGLIPSGGPARGAPAGGDADITTQQEGPPRVTAEAHYLPTIPEPAAETSPSSQGFASPSVVATPGGADAAPSEVSSVVTGLPPYAPSTSSGGESLAGPHPCVQVKVGPTTTPACDPTPPGGSGQGGGGGRSGPGGVGPPPSSPEELAVLAADRAIAAAPRLRLRVAPSDVGLTGLESYFWLANRPQPITAVARVPGLTVVAEARPVQYVWQFGDGAEEVTTEPGTPLAPRQARIDRTSLRGQRPLSRRVGGDLGGSLATGGKSVAKPRVLHHYQSPRLRGSSGGLAVGSGTVRDRDLTARLKGAWRP
jgi:hypothetical protein